MSAVVFDLDGVLADSRAPIATSTNEALAAHGLRTPALVATYREIHWKRAVEAARANGIGVVGVLWGIGSEADLAGADAVVATPLELLAYLGSAA